MQDKLLADVAGLHASRPWSTGESAPGKDNIGPAPDSLMMRQELIDLCLTCKMASCRNGDRGCPAWKALARTLGGVRGRKCAEVMK